MNIKPVLMSLCMIAAVCLPVMAADAVQTQVLVDEGDRVVLSYTFDAYRSQAVDIDGQIYQEFMLPGEPIGLDAGDPTLPYVCRSIIIPDDAHMTVRVLDGQFHEIAAQMIPSKGNLPRTIDPDSVPYVFGPAYAMHAFYPGDLAELHLPYIMRDHRGITVRVNPFQYNPVTGIVRVYTRMTVEIYADGPGEVNVLKRDWDRGLSPAFHQIYTTHFLNYNLGGRYTPLDEEGDMLIICHDAWIPNVAALATHKASAGITATVVGVATIGNNSTSIKNYIQGVYNGGNLAYVLLVGDAAQVATPPGDTDPTYAKLAGSDDYPDIMVGRFSAETAAHVDTQVQRTIDYENLPATEQDWFWKGTGIASSEGAGIGDEGQADWVHMDEIRQWLLAAGYTEVDQIYATNGGTAAQVTAALNEGRGVINYCGHGSDTYWVTTGFSNSDVNALVNDNMLPFIVSVACVNGNFVGQTCFAEAWLRATNGGTPTGAIGMYASTINQSWAPPMEGQDEFNLLLTDASEPYHSYGALCFAGSCSMMDDYGANGVNEFDHWTIFGDPSLRVIGTIGPPHGLKVQPGIGFYAEGQAGGPFTPDSIEYTLENYEEVPLAYEVTRTQPWLTITNATGTIPAGGNALVTVALNATANTLGNGQYNDTLQFVNLTNHDGDTTRMVTLKVGVPTMQYEWPLDSDPGWSTAGQWAFGKPLGGGGSSYGNPDPTSGYTGNSVYGVNLNGDYSTSVGGPYYLTLGPIDLTDCTDVSLKFQRWLNTDYQPFVYATFDVSNNGSNWTQVWENGGSEIADSAWSLYEYDLSATAADQATVYVRWGYQVTSGAWAYSGWNIDDIEIWALASGQPPYPIGDLNCDLEVNAYDIDCFVCALSLDCDYDTQCPDCNRMLADCNGDGDVNSYDIDPFVLLVGGG
ncbi:MAG: C25 family cysteine peptidase [Planctomycetota bacterium]